MEKFTENEIKEWLSGWLVCDSNGKAVGELGILDVINLVGCDQDGISAWKKRSSQKEYRYCGYCGARLKGKVAIICPICD